MLSRDVIRYHSRNVYLASPYFRRELKLRYQPIFSLKSKDLYGFETLVSWQSNRAKLYQGNLHDLIAQSRFYEEYHQWMFYEACRQIELWQVYHSSEKALYLGINLSERQLSYSKVYSFVEEIFEKIDLEPTQIQLEIPAQWTAKNLTMARKIITYVKMRNMSICIDNFEPSPAFFQCLKVLPPVDALKLSTQCTQQLAKSSQCRMLCDEMIKIAGMSDVAVISKGIETQEQLNAVETLGCTYGQGYLLSYPIESHQAIALIAKQIHKLVVYLAAMDTLRNFAQTFLGDVLVAKYWQATKPTKSWLTSLTPHNEKELLQSWNQEIQLDSLQEEDLRCWAHQFIRRCSQIIRGFHELLLQSELSTTQKQLLGI
ncbi:EAL domain-containing protein [Leptolyngbya cf. ectocarpi LEGE 11479]|uniref:EAL domain-containing protein n=1 Tax=Leptolyngbya cf. ectocarpi LEGE 11479 TaxID=1828722 RepID=A0A928X2X9_LEPEC|nr:EAL domain-containing protein [Leptolyngbya ectocarpi]MBE9066801.1 EAL domain-containing protein [Leptolyngbya cf. ectocarpi LEGE 11479]